MYVETNLPNDQQNNEMTPKPEEAAKPLGQDNGNTEVAENCQEKSDPQHADTPSLQAIRQATASIFADLNSNLESIKQFESGSTPEKNEQTNTLAENSTQNGANTSHVPPPPPTLIREDTPVSAEEKTAAIPSNIMLKTSPGGIDKQMPANMPQQKRQQKDTQQQQGEIVSKYQGTQQTVPKKNKRRGTNAHLLLKKASMQAAMPKQAEVKKKKPKKKVRNHLAHLAKVEAVFTDETGDSNSPSSFNNITPSVDNGTTAPGQPLQAHQMCNKVTMHRIITIKMPRNITIITEQTIRRVIMPNSNNIIKVRVNRMPTFKIPHTHSNSNHMAARKLIHNKRICKAVMAVSPMRLIWQIRLYQTNKSIK